jgi:hypothetical protein
MPIDNVMDTMVHFIEATDRAWDAFIPANKIAMIDIPIIDLKEGARELDEEMEDEKMDDE